MKKIFFLSIALFGLFSCSQDDVIYNAGEFVQFKNADVSEVLVMEHRGFAKLDLLLSNASTSDLTVNFEYTDVTAVANVNYIPVPNVTIPAGETSFRVSIPVVNDNEINADRQFIVKMVGTSDPNYKAGIGQLSTSEKSVKISNEDLNCISNTDYTYWLGDVLISEEGYPPSSAVVSLHDCDIIKLYGDIYGLNVKANHLISFTRSAANRSIGTVNLPPTLTGAANSSYKIGIRATGSYNSITGNLVLNYTLTAHDLVTGVYLGNFSNTGTVTITVNE